MEDWPASSILPPSASITSIVGNDLHQRRPGRALQDLSGNAQPYASNGVIVDAPKGVTENLHHLAHQQSHHQQHFLQPSFSKNGLPLLRPYGSQPQTASITPIDRKRSYQDGPGEPQVQVSSRMGPRGYLDSQKYKDYRARPRRDTGPDGQAVWSDELEEAFQEALRRHPPMGRKKMTQYEKPYGRNELVAEEIFQMTGQRRTRKQVSSHIQVLNSKLKGDPDWERLVKAPEGGENDIGANYYSTSIADGAHRYQQQQAHKRQRLVDPYYSDHGAIGQYNGPVVPSSQWTLRSNVPENHSCQIQALNFNMRIVSPGEERRTIDKAFHVYTQLQGDQAGGAPSPLEEIGDWRFFFPRLAEIVEEDRSRRVDCDIILMEASLQLMDTYPPRGSKLGIDLDLEYANPITRSICLPEGLKKAFCVTHFYNRHGDSIDCKQSDLPSIENQSRIRAVFESGWWAKLLGNLTEQRLAAAQEDRESVNAADEEVRKCFRSLTAVQEVYGCGSDQDQSGSGNRRLAIILWKFRQTLPREVGTSSWRKLIPPPGRESLNSPGPLIETMSAGPLGMDALLMSSHHPSSQDVYHDAPRHAPHGHPASYMVQDRDFSSQHHPASGASQHADVPGAQWHEYPNIPDDGIDPEILSPLGLPSYDVLLSMNQQKDAGHSGQSRNPGGMSNGQIVQGLDGNFEAAIAGLDGITDVGVPNRVASTQWSSTPNFTESRMPSDTIRGSGHLDGRADSQHPRMHRMHQDLSMQLARSELERHRQQQVTPSQQPTPRLRTPFEGNQAQSSMFASTSSTHPGNAGQNSLAFSQDLQNVGSQVDMDDNLQAFLDAAAADMGTFDADHNGGSRVDNLRYQPQQQALHRSGHSHPAQQRAMWQQSPTNLQGGGSFDQHYQSQPGPDRLYRTHSQSSHQPQVPSRPQSANVSAAGSPHPHHQQARLGAGKPQTRPLTPASMQNGRHLRTQGQLSVQTGQQVQQRAHEYAGGSADSPTAYGLSQSRPQSQQQQHYTLRSPLADAGTGSQGGQGPASGELVDRLVDHVRAGVDGPHGLDGHDIPRVERRPPVLGEPWKGVDNRESESGDGDAHAHHQRFAAGNTSAIVGHIGAE